MAAAAVHSMRRSLVVGSTLLLGLLCLTDAWALSEAAIRARVDQADDAIAAGRIDEALATLNTTLSDASSAGASAALLGLVHTRLAIAHFYRRDVEAIGRHASLGVRSLENEPGALADYADALGAWSLYLGESGQTERYLENGMRELEVRRKLPEATSRLSVPLTTIGIAHAQLGDLRAAERSLREALEFASRDPENVAERTRIQTNLAYVYSLRHESRSAARMLEPTIEAARATAPDSVLLALRLSNLGQLYVSLEDYEAARSALSEALELQQRLVPSSEDEARTLHGLGRIAAAEGDHHSAVSYFRASADILSERQPDSPNIARPLRGLGDALSALGQPEGAEPVLRRAIELAAAAGQPANYASSLYALGRFERKRGNADLAIALMGDAVVAVEAQYDLLGGTVESIASFSSFYEGLYKDLSDMLLQRGEYERAIDLLESFRERALLDRIDARRLLLQSAHGESLSRELGDLRAEATRRLGNMAGRVDGRPSLTDFWKLELAALNARRRDIVEEALESDSRLAALWPSTANVDDLALAADQRLLYFRLGGTRSHVLVLDGRSISAFVLPPRDELESLVRRYAVLLKTPTSERGSLDELASELYESLLGPAATALRGAREFIVAPEGPLLHIPFSALRDRDGAYLVERVRVRQVASVASFNRGRLQRDDRRARFVGIAYDAGLGEVAGPQTRNVGRLQFVDDEVRHSAALFLPDAQALIGARATPSAVRRAGKSDILHFATHAVVDWQEPMRSFVSLAPEPGDDGRLELWEIMESLRVDSSLVVLSACDSAVGPLYAGEGMLGLAKGFAYAGADAVIASLWPVADESTSRFFEAFYAVLVRQGSSRAEALRQAQWAMAANEPVDGLPWSRRLRSLLPGRDYSHPYYWAPFVLTGGN